MNDLILHHYAGSPFSEKVRLILGYKGLAWKSVTVPVILPKPDVVALTGGYRRTPFLQVGADIYCDTALMCRVIDRIAPTPPLYPTSAGGVQSIVAHWADTSLFWTAIPYTMQPAGVAHMFAGAPPEMLKAFGADRAAMTAGFTRRPTPTDAFAQLQSEFGWLEQQLGDRRRYLCGEAASIADFSVAQSLWYIRRVPSLATILGPFARLTSWYERVQAFGHGKSETMSSGDAIALARSTTTRAAIEFDTQQGFAPGEEVTVTPTDYAQDPVAGRLVGLSYDQVTIEREDPRAGTLRVHFPRIGFQIRKQDKEGHKA
jgi:glutathione S-transferase